AHQQRRPFSQSRRLQVPRRPQERRRQRVVIRRRLLHVERDDLLPLPHHHPVRRSGQGQRLLPAAPVLARVHLLRRLPVPLLKEPLSFLAAQSAPPVVHPVDRVRHRLPSVSPAPPPGRSSPPTPGCRPSGSSTACNPAAAGTAPPWRCAFRSCSGPPSRGPPAPRGSAAPAPAAAPARCRGCGTVGILRHSARPE